MRISMKAFLRNLLPGPAVLALPLLSAGSPAPVVVEPEASVVRWVNVRSGPSVRAPKVGRLLPAQKVELVSDSYEGWYEVRLGEGLIGFVSKQYARPASLNVKSSPVDDEISQQLEALKTRLDSLEGQEDVGLSDILSVVQSVLEGIGIGLAILATVITALASTLAFVGYRTVKSLVANTEAKIKENEERVARSAKSAEEHLEALEIAKRNADEGAHHVATIRHSVTAGFAAIEQLAKDTDEYDAEWSEVEDPPPVSPQNAVRWEDLDSLFLVASSLGILDAQRGSEALRKLAKYWNGRLQHDKAAARAREAVRLDRENVAAHCILARAAIYAFKLSPARRELYDEAMNALAMAKDLHARRTPPAAPISRLKDDQLVVETRGLVAAHVGNWQESTDCFREGKGIEAQLAKLENRAPQGFCTFNLACGYSRLGLISEATEEIREAVHLGTSLRQVWEDEDLALLREALRLDAYQVLVGGPKPPAREGA